MCNSTSEVQILMQSKRLIVDFSTQKTRRSKECNVDRIVIKGVNYEEEGDMDKEN